MSSWVMKWLAVVVVSLQFGEPGAKRSGASQNSNSNPRLAIIDEAGEMVERLNAFHTSEAKYWPWSRRPLVSDVTQMTSSSRKAPATPCC